MHFPTHFEWGRARAQTARIHAWLRLWPGDDGVLPRWPAGSSLSRPK